MILDNDDFALVHRHPEREVRCLKPGCPVLLTAVRNQRGTRFFRAKSGTSCDHFDVIIEDRGEPPTTATSDAHPPPGGGGPETDEHIWFKIRFHRICRALGLSTIIEDPRTHADVFLPAAGLALEYQRWATDFADRTAARKALGVRTLWLVPQLHDKSERAAALGDQVFQHGGVYVGAFDTRTWKPVTPWAHPSENEHGRLFVWGTVASYHPSTRTFRTGRKSLATFLDEVASGRRELHTVWVDSETKSSKPRRRYVWVLTSEFMMYTKDRAPKRIASPAPAPVLAAPVPTPLPQATEPSPIDADADHPPAVQPIELAPPPHPEPTPPLVPDEPQTPSAESIWRRLWRWLRNQ